MTSTFRIMKFNYKLVYSNNVGAIEICSSNTISNFITKLKIEAKTYYNINAENIDIEIVEAGNETSPKLEASEITLEEKYGSNYVYKSFYIRINILERNL